MLDHLENDINESLRRIDHNLARLERATHAHTGRVASEALQTVEHLRRRFRAARVALRKIKRQRRPGHGRPGHAETLMNLQVAVKDLDLAARQARRQHDHGRNRDVLAELFSTRRW